MNSNQENLNHKIREAVQLIAALREENIALKGRLRELEGALRKETGKGKVDAEIAVKMKKMKEELKYLKSDRMTIRKKVRSALRKLEGIKLKEKRSDQVQRDLFGRD
ncbi:MAG: hypothetical protein GXP58_08525 [Deltaproteobacteria bacterium]|nr:hypothetical protein [Deltaproteobacteria bacterium]